MENTRNRSGRWMSLVAEAYVEAESEHGTDFIKKVQEKMNLGSEKAAAALVEGIETLAQYIETEDDCEKRAIDEETEAVSVAMAIVRPVLETKLQMRLDLLDEKLKGQTTCPSCEQSGESQGRIARNWTSLVGMLKLKRRYVHCKRCQQADEGKDNHSFQQCKALIFLHLHTPSVSQNKKAGSPFPVATRLSFF